MRRIALVLVSLLVVAGLAACGGGGNGNANDQAQIKAAYQKFFSSKTSQSDRVAVLQDGTKFRRIISALANNPLASNTSATVSSVTLTGANSANVVFTVDVSGSALLKNEKGTAVRMGGSWKVGYASLCKLLALEGSTPAACKS